MNREDKGEEEIVCLDESFFINDDYQLTTFTFGSQVLQLFCLQSASTDFDLTGQLVWPGAMLMNDYISKNAELLQGSSIIELGSGVGITGILCSRFCREVVLTDHNDEVLKARLGVEKLEWGNSDQINQILHKYSGGFDLILGADIYIRCPRLLFIFQYESNGSRCISFQQSSIPPLFDTVEQFFRIRETGQCKFILAYVSRAKMMDAMVISEATRHGMLINEIAGTRSAVGNLEGVIFQVTLK
ncbi:hypothetical protein Pint_05509 [Pistacia integerrima]|uniref:Uncharacterized protein n=1 Tax=Pistacia integerrima TaxID=434235 RepID=A0ACC0Z8X0_9ROSI|nr:hypothetical protein Pint_05509 [Pistacia integerrima]